MFQFSGFSIAQNLVINGSFEDTIKCPSVFFIDSSCYDWTEPLNHEGTPDYFHICANNSHGIPLNNMGYQDTCNGNAYAGVNIYNADLSNNNQNSHYREYLMGSLNQKLYTNKCYKVSLKYSLAEGISEYYIKNLSLLFSDNPVLNNAPIDYQANNLNYQPQIEFNQWLIDDENWVTLERFYKASGGEEYFVIGNFKDNNNTDTLLKRLIPSLGGVNVLSYIYIDDVRVEEVPFQTLGELNLGGDTILCKGEELTFNNILPDSTVYVWNQLSNDTAFTIDSSGQYILEAFNGCSYTTDTINIEFVEPKVELGNDILACKREQVILQPLTPQHPSTQYNWYKETNQLSTNQLINITEEGIYSLTANIGHCVDSDTIEVDYEIPENSIFQTQNLDTTFCVSGILDAGSTIWNDTYLWNTNEETQTIEVTETGTYSVYAENECTEATSHFNVKVESLEEGLNNYNIFSPNNDFINDLFTIYEGDSEEYQLQIFNRWGKLVWETTDPEEHWDGKSGVSLSLSNDQPDLSEGVSDGTYYYHLTFRNCAGELVEKKGVVEVRR